ncbi:hypothetical protein KJ641_01750 [Patescibacteria group bacterium]|nr:hypothetical protein [Patescibacteria group bacterium]
MALTQVQQISQLLEDKKHILITFRTNANGDAISSAIAMFLFLERLGKRVDIVCQDFSLPKNYKFLKDSKLIKSEIYDLKKFIITLDVKDAGLRELSYDVKNEKLRIFITPKQGVLTSEQVKTAQSDFKYDLIITVSSQDLDSLGSLYENNTELFYKTPIINIDNDAGNEHYGHINLVDITATSTAEILYELFGRLGEEYIDNAIATALLTGMIANTRSFKTENIKPHTLANAGKLITLGANRDHIVEQLYRTRSISTLKLWGEALSHLESERGTGLVSTTITRDNFIRSGAEEKDLYDVMDEIISNSPEAKVILIFHEHENTEGLQEVHIILRSNNKSIDAKNILNTYSSAEGDSKQAICMTTGKTLKQTESEVLETIKLQLK